MSTSNQVLSCEGSTRVYNYKKDPVDTRDFKFHLKFNTVDTKILPNSVDLRRGNLLPPAFDQLSLGSCASNATSNALRFLLKRDKKREFIPSRLFIYYFSRLLQNTINEDSGCSIRECMKAIATYGCCSENLWPYKINDFTKIPPEQCKKAGLTHTKNFKYMSVNQNLKSIKNALAQGFPIIFGISIYESFDTENVLKSGKVPLPNISVENSLGGHAILLVAYDDVTRIFTFLNSWGVGTLDNPIGDKGFFTIPYDYVLNPNLASDFWICTGFS